MNWLDQRTGLIFSRCATGHLWAVVKPTSGCIRNACSQQLTNSIARRSRTLSQQLVTSSATNLLHACKSKGFFTSSSNTRDFHYNFIHFLYFAISNDTSNNVCIISIPFNGTFAQVFRIYNYIWDFCAFKPQICTILYFIPRYIKIIWMEASCALIIWATSLQRAWERGCNLGCYYKSRSNWFSSFSSSGHEFAPTLECIKNENSSSETWSNSRRKNSNVILVIVIECSLKNISLSKYSRTKNPQDASRRGTCSVVTLYSTQFLHIRLLDTRWWDDDIGMALFHESFIQEFWITQFFFLFHDE